MPFLERLTQLMHEVKEVILATRDLAKELHTPTSPQRHPWDAPPNPSVEDIAVSQKEIEEYEEILKMCQEPAAPDAPSAEAAPTDT